MHETMPFLGEALGQSENFLSFSENLSQVAGVERPVLLMGERGTGKELAAHKIHFLSSRWQGPFVALNCAALSPTLMESELFGHEAGAFTGATYKRLGRFEMANEGTLFLDEISLIPMEVQEKILRVVEYMEFERVGGSVPVQVDVRIVAATHEELPSLAASGRFKQDLLDRLSFEVLFLPPLRERGEDILLLARHFGNRMALELGRPEPPVFSREAEQALLAYAWPGNVRELKNVVERAVYRTKESVVTEIDFDPFQSPYTPKTSQQPQSPQDEKVEPSIALPFPTGSLKEAVLELEATALQEALKRTRYNQKRAAKLLGLTYHQFRGLYRKHAK